MNFGLNLTISLIAFAVIGQLQEVAAKIRREIILLKAMQRGRVGCPADIIVVFEDISRACAKRLTNLWGPATQTYWLRTRAEGKSLEADYRELMTIKSHAGALCAKRGGEPLDILILSSEREESFARSIANRLSGNLSTVRIRTVPGA